MAGLAKIRIRSEIRCGRALLRNERFDGADELMLFDRRER